MLGSAVPMTRSLRCIVPLVAVLALAVGACGGDKADPKAASADRASASSDVNQLLRATFANLDKMGSATVDLKLRIDSRNGGAAQAPVTAHLSGPFASRGSDKLPAFAFTA